MGRNPTQNEGFKKVISYFVGQEEVELSLSPTVVMPLLTVQDKPYNVRVLMDSGSMTNWLAKDLLDKLNHTVKGHTSLEVYTLTGSTIKKFKLVEIYYYYNGQKHNLTCYVHDAFAQHVTVRGMPEFIRRSSVLTEDISNSLVDPATQEVDHKDVSLGIGLILCTASSNKIRMNSVINLSSINILLEPTIFGTAISGSVPPTLRGNMSALGVYHTVPRLVGRPTSEALFRVEDEEEEVLKENLRFLGNQESLGISDKEVHADDEKAWEHFIETTKRTEQGVFEVRMPFNDKVDLLKTNIKKAAGRTRSEQSEMLKSPAYKEAMLKAHQTFIDKDSVEPVDNSVIPEGPVYYMPFRGILKVGSSTDCRICMDASSKPSASDVSLNQVIYQGPNLVLNLAVLLLKFMKGKFGVIADLEKAFLRILIAKQDRDVLRYFWFSNPDDMHSPLIVMRFKVVIFGSKASPFQLAAVIHILIRDECHNNMVKSALQHSIYVDNIVHSSDIEENLVKFYEVSRKIFSKGNFNLRQWVSNSKKVMTRATSENVGETDRLVKVLGMYWDIDRDRYLFCCGFEWNGEFTKRSALAFSCKVFDPLGILSPITTRNKVFLQCLWKFTLKWDESFEFLLDGELKDKWLHLVREVHVAMKCQVNRRAVTSNPFEIHTFTDASGDSYGAVTYVRTLPCTEYPDGHVSLVTAKGKVAPLKGNKTIPKLELAGVVVGAHQGKFVKKAWDIPIGVKYYMWIDAKVCIRWLGQYNIKETFVHNRVKQIRELVDKENTVIRYIPSELNPADLITKEQNALEFSNNLTWFQGPSFLAKEENWPEDQTTCDLFPEGCEQKVSTYKITIKETKEESALKFFSNRSFAFNLRVLAMIQRIAQRKSFRGIRTDDIFTREEINRAKVSAIQTMQWEMFPRELKALQENKKIDTIHRKLNLYLEGGIMRCRGRLANLVSDQIGNTPILVNGGHPFVQSLIRYHHIHYNCATKRYTLNKIRKMVHGPSLKTAVDSVCRQCWTCKLLRSQPYSYPRAPPLPKERVLLQAPFTVCGVDYAGPFKVKRGRGTEKVWIALYTCMVSRAIYLNIVPDLTAECFLGSLRALAWTYRQPLVLMSDNATCFAAANKVLKELRNKIEIQTELNTKGIKWIFTPTSAPWFGAVYERMIGTLKREMVKMLGSLKVTYFELDVHLKEITGVINNRPLAVVGREEVISPNNILTGRSDNDHNMLETPDLEELLNQAMTEKHKVPQLFIDTERRREIFWNRFREQYLESIKFDQKPNQDRPGLSPKEGDVVIVYDKSHKLFWSKAIVLQLIQSEDGLVRKAKVRMNNTDTIKAISHLYPLETRVEEEIEEYHRDKGLNTFDFEGFSQDNQAKNKKRLQLLRKNMATAIPSDTEDDDTEVDG